MARLVAVLDANAYDRRHLDGCPWHRIGIENRREAAINY